MKVRHFLYNAFLIEAGNSRIAIDPGQNLWIFKLESLIPKPEWDGITHILVTHGDPDHYWQADRVAEASGAPLFCGKDLARLEAGRTLLVDPRGRGLTSWIAFPDAHPLDVGETAVSGAVRIEAIRAVHGPISIPFLGLRLRRQPGPGERTGLGSVGFRISVGGKTIVNLGDSILQPEWEGLEPDVLMLPIGGMGNGTWTMDVSEALAAVQLISPKLVIPCHFNVPFFWSRNMAPADGPAFRQAVERLGIRCELMQYGEEIEL